MLVLTSPVSRNGGCTSIPGSTSSGLRPTPSGGVTGLTSNGEARKASAKRKAASTTPTVATACGPPQGMRGTVMRTKAAMNSDIVHDQKRSEPGCPLYSDAHLNRACMSLDETEATCAIEKSLVSRA